MGSILGADDLKGQPASLWGISVRAKGVVSRESHAYVAEFLGCRVASSAFGYLYYIVFVHLSLFLNITYCMLWLLVAILAHVLL